MIGIKTQDIIANIKSPNAFYFGFYMISLSGILKVLKGEVGKNNHALLLNVIPVSINFWPPYASSYNLALIGKLQNGRLLMQIGITFALNYVEF